MSDGNFLGDSLACVVSTQKHLLGKVFILLCTRPAGHSFPAAWHALKCELQSHYVRISCLVFLKTPCLIRCHIVFIFESSVFCLPAT